jgi:hypothetical protein
MSVSKILTMFGCERGDRLRLALEPRAPLGLGRERRRQDFNRDVTLKTGVVTAIDLAHPARGLDGFAPVSSSSASPDGSPGEASTPSDVGTGIGERTVQVHNPRYDFNGDALAIGASYWVMLAEQQLPASGSRPPS